MKPLAAVARHVLASLCLCALAALGVGQAHAQEIATATYVHTDTNNTTVVAPRLRVMAPVAEETSVTAVYAVDVWTSASIDIMTSASPYPVTEQRDELDVSLDHAIPDLTFSVAYRMSTEPDYVSHGVSGGVSYDMADKSSTLALGLSANADTQGRAGDPNFARAVSTFGGRLSFTQVIDAQTVAQAQYELSSTQGFLSSAYRYVAIGAPGGCAGPAPLCVAEHNPGERLRHAGSLYARRSLGDALSAGAGYRLYLDDWGVLAHTVRLEVGYMADEHTTLSARYRFYAQGAADHYQRRYLVLADYVTRDKELSPLSSHRLGLELERMWHFANDKELSATLAIAPVYYSYSDFFGLESITAFEVNAALGLTL